MRSSSYSAALRSTRPLKCLPLSSRSLKDNFKVKGYDSTVGFVACAFSISRSFEVALLTVPSVASLTGCNEPMETESVLTTLLRKSGAVLFCKTNTSTAMMMGERYGSCLLLRFSAWRLTL